MDRNNNRNHRDGEDNIDYYRKRAMQRKRERELKKRRRKIVLTGIVVVVIILAVIITSVSCISGCVGGSGSSSANATQPETSAETVAETSAATQAATDSSDATNPGDAEDAKGKVSPSYFDDAVFVGDSVTMSFQMYVDSQRNQGIDCLGKAYMLCAGSLGYTNAVLLPAGDPDSVLPVYQGVQQSLEDSIAQIGAKKIYIMLGMNDIGGYPMDDVMDNANTVLTNIHNKNPDAKIYIESVTPTIRANPLEHLNNELIREFNSKMKTYADEHGYGYLDIYSVVSDEDGYLKDEYCSDPDAMGIHFLESADIVWEDYLLKHPEGK